MSTLNYLIKHAGQHARQWWLAATGRRAVHFLHIGKTGDSAIRTALHNAPEPTRYKLYIHRHGTVLKDVPRGELAVFVVRDPVARFVSGFYNRQRRGRPKTDVAWSDDAWSDDERIAFSRFETPNQLALALAGGSPELQSAARHAMTHIQHVRSPLSNWLGSPAYLQSRADDVLFIGFQESLDRDFEDLKTLLGLGDDVSLPTDDVLAHRNSADCDIRLDPLAVHTIRGWYQSDYALIQTCHTLRGDEHAQAPVPALNGSTVIKFLNIQR